MREHGGAIVSLDFDARVAWPIYDWMGWPRPRSSRSRGTSRAISDRTGSASTLSAGPLRTIAGKAIPGFQALADGWGDRAPLGWNPTDATPVADTIVFLLSDLSRGITGEMVHVDGGYHAMGSAPPSVARRPCLG